MKRYAIAIIIVFLFILGFSCKTDLDLNEKWREIPVVFGLLDKGDSVHYVKISKAFLGEGNAITMAGIYDSLYYKPSDLNVYISEYKSDILLQSWSLVPDSTIFKDPGMFNNPKQIIYRLDAKLSYGNEYRLTLKNIVSGLEASAQTELVNDFKLMAPGSSKILDFSEPAKQFLVSFYTPYYGKAYNLTVRFWYTEKNKFTSVINEKYIDWVFPVNTSSSTMGNEQVGFSFYHENFYTFLKSRLAPNDSVWRYVGKAQSPSYQIDFLVAAAAETFYAYIEANAPTNGPLMEKPFYTNINNGVGLFSSRIISKNQNLFGKMLNSASMDSVYAGQYTYHLGFCDPIPNKTYSCN